MAIANITNNILTDSGVATSSLLTTSAAASTYLALAGGTLTGALSGTSATFSSSVTAGGTITLNNASANYATLNLNGAAGYGAELKFGEVTGGYLAAIRHNYNVGTGLEFYTGGIGAGNLRMYISPTGNVGIGTSSPSNKLDIQNGSDFDIRLKDTSLGGTVGILFETANDFSGTSQAYIKGIGAGNSGLSQLIFGTAGASGDTTATERMRITSGGNLLIGATSTGAYFDGIINAFGSGTTPAACFKNDGTSGQITSSFWNALGSGDNIFMDFVTETSYTKRGSISFNRSAGLVVYNTTSDYRLKSEISDFNALNIIDNLKPKEFRIGDAVNKSIGFIAHELQEYLPQAVSGKKDAIDKDGNPIYQSVDYSQLTGLLVKAIQELKAEIETLKIK
jgi:hypothetical protein